VVSGPQAHGWHSVGKRHAAATRYNARMNNQRQAAVADWVRDYVKKEVRDQLRRAAMARTREDFSNRLVEVLMPALRHYYRAMLGILNERTDQVDQWEEHEQAFLDQFEDRMSERTRAKGLDRRAAAEKAFEEMMDHDAAHRRVEAAKFQKAHKLKKVVPLPEDAGEGFINKVKGIVEELFASDE